MTLSHCMTPWIAMQVQAAFNTFKVNPLDPQVGNSFNYQCELYPPEGFLTFLTQQLTADGMWPLSLHCLSVQPCTKVV